jgi:hypothetical protein
LHVQLYDRDGNPTDSSDLVEIVQESELEQDYLNEHMLWNAPFIDTISIVSITNNKIMIEIKHNSSLEHLISYLNDYIANEAPYHDYLMLFYEGDEHYQMSILNVEIVE